MMILLSIDAVNPMFVLFLFVFVPFIIFIFMLKLIDELTSTPNKIKYYCNKISTFIHSPRFLVSDKNLKYITLFAAVVKCDGWASPEEIDFVKKYIFLSPQFKKYRVQSIHFFESEVEDVNVRFIGYRTANVPFFMLDRKNISGESISVRVSDMSTDLFSAYLSKYADRMEFLDVLFQIAYSQTGVSDVEVNFLREVAYSLYIKSWDFTSLLYKYEYIKEKQQKQQKQQKKEQERKEKNGAEEKEHRKSSENRFKSVAKTRKMEALQLLEITENADEQEIKSAYRRMAKKYHPDTLSANVSEEEKEAAAARFRSIHEAYDFLLSLEMVRAN